MEEEVEQYKMLHLKSVASRVCNDLKTSEKHKEDLEMLYAGCQEELKNSIPISVIQNKINQLDRAIESKQKGLKVMQEINYKEEVLNFITDIGCLEWIRAYLQELLEEGNK